MEENKLSGSGKNLRHWAVKQEMEADREMRKLKMEIHDFLKNQGRIIVVGTMADLDKPNYFKRLWGSSENDTP